jgi:hypothetical protein
MHPTVFSRRVNVHIMIYISQEEQYRNEICGEHSRRPAACEFTVSAFNVMEKRIGSSLSHD